MDLIIGAGISGLSYANFCDHNDYLIIEKENSVGGYCKTLKKDGFIWDYSGHFFHFRNEDIKNYIVNRMNKEDVFYIKKQTQIKYKDRYIDFPFQQNIHQLEKEELIDCLYDLFFKENKKYSTFKEMIYAKFGKSISHKFLIPYNEKVYVCDLDSLDAEAMGRFFPYANIKEIVGNFRKNQINSYNTFFTYPKGGAVQYIDALIKDIDTSKISLSEKLISIDIQRKQAKTDKRIIHYKNLISSIPFNKLLEKCNIEYDPKIYDWNKVLVFNLGFDRGNNNIKNHWIYYPEKKYSFYRVGFYNNILSQPRLSLYVEVGFSKDIKINIQDERNKVLKDLKLSGIVKDQKLIAEQTIIMDPAYVHINKKSQDDVSDRMIDLNMNSVYSIGRYGGWKYCSIEDCMVEAKQIAELLNNGKS